MSALRVLLLVFKALIVLGVLINVCIAFPFIVAAQFFVWCAKLSVFLADSCTKIVDFIMNIEKKDV